MRISKVRSFIESHLYLLLIPLMGMFNLSCNKENVENELHETYNYKQYSGSSMEYTDHQIFRGIVFAQNPVADEIPELSGLDIRTFDINDTLLTEIESLYDQTLNVVDSLHPGFVNEFASAMRSGNHLLISSQIDSAQLILSEVVANTLNTYDASLQNDSTLSTDANHLITSLSDKGEEARGKAIRDFLESQILSQGPNEPYKEVHVAVEEAAAVYKWSVVAVAIVAVVLVAAALVLIAKPPALNLNIADGDLLYKKGLERDMLINSIATNLGAS